MAFHQEVTNRSFGALPVRAMRTAPLRFDRFNQKRDGHQLEVVVRIPIPLTFRSNISERAVICKPALTQAAFHRLDFRISAVWRSI